MMGASIPKILYIAGATLIGTGVLLGMISWLMRRRYGDRSPTRASEGDLAHMMILLQTMRDILEQQKDLARKLNRSLDGKVAYIRDTVRAALADVETMRGEMKASAEQLAALKKETAQLRNELQQIRQDAKRVPPVSSTVDEPSPAATHLSEDDAVSVPELQSIHRPGPDSLPKDLLDEWKRIQEKDTGELDTAQFPVPEKEPEEPGDPERAREAFRALLDLEEDASMPAEQATAPPPSSGEKEKGMQSQGQNRNNGTQKKLPLQARVYQYSDAGMTISQIAREMGIGKGEVRLILSLRKDRER